MAARLRLLGTPELEGRWPLRFLPERRFRLLAFLALRGDWVGRDELATLFWPDRTQEAARSNLRKLLHEARALDLPQLEADRASVRWRVVTDVAEYLAALRRGDTQAALALYRGPALQGLEGGESDSFGTWLAGERRRLHAAWREAVVATLPHRDPAGTLSMARLLLDDDPFDEDAIVAALDAYRSLGDGRGAAEAFRGYAERLIEELGVEPSARVRSAAAPVTGRVPRADGPATAPEAAHADEPSSPTALSFIGRGHEMQELSALLANPGCRLLTVTGPGGMGKSTLVKQATRGLASRYADGVLWIALDDLTDVDQVAPRIASELSLALAPAQDPVERIAAHLAPRQTLLVLDNAEHLPRLAALVERLLGAAARLQVLTTSRARIGLPREWLLPLAGLALPPADGSARDSLAVAAVQLFVAHARATDPRFASEANAPYIVQLVRAVGGLPLAILLAASWVRLLPVSELAREVTLSLDVLEGADEGEERPEHRSVRATFEQSWRWLAPAEQRALSALSIMVGAFSRSAAKDVAHAPLPLLAALVDKSLLQVDARGRFSLHPLIQQFAAEKLAPDPALCEVVRERHAQAFARFMAQYERFDAVDQAAAVGAIAAELSNVLAAWNWAIARARIDVLQRCMAGLSGYFQWRGPIVAAAELFGRAQAVVDAHATSLTGETRRASWGIPLERAALSYSLGDYRQVEAAARKALEAARAVADAYGVRTSLNMVALALMRLGRIDEGARLHEEALASAIDDKAASEIVDYTSRLVEVRREQGDDEGALVLAREALNGYRAAGQKSGEIMISNSIGLILHSLGRFPEAIEAYEEGLRLAGAAGMEVRRATLLTHKASACLDAGEFERAGQSGQEALQITLSRGLLAHEPACRRTLADIDMAGGDLGAARAQLGAAIVAARRNGTPNVMALTLRSCSAYLERCSDPAVALRCTACADAHRFSAAKQLVRYRGQRDRLLAVLDPTIGSRAETEGAALTLQAALDLAERAIDAT